MDILAQIRSEILGERQWIDTPFGARPLIYADYTASGRSLRSVERFIEGRVLPFYANTHSESSLTGRQSSRLREEARQTIKRAVNAGDDDALIFCGNGATAAINRLIAVLGLQLPTDRTLAQWLLARLPAAQRPAVFIGPYEHHSNELPWRESLCTVVTVPLDASGCLDLAALAQLLREYAGRPLRIGSFSAASNVTGIRTDTVAVGRVLADHGALRCWDYAAAAPYVAIDMADKDAVFISPHKFIGGPGTPGVLVIKRALASHGVPAIPGGGTVSFVTPTEHDYLTDIERREEGGTPGIVETIRAGLVFRLQQQVGTDRIEALEAAHLGKAIAAWRKHPRLRILGSPEAPRLSIVSLQVLGGDRPLHYGFVVVLLNDLFGIQARGGCSCAGPYGHYLLGLDAESSAALREDVQRGNPVMRPGWVRLNFNYFLDTETVDYLIRAVLWIADHGARVQALYTFDRQSGCWVRHGSEASVPVALAQFALGTLYAEQHRCELPLDTFLLKADEIMRQLTGDLDGPSSCGIELDDCAQSRRWFFLPGDAIAAGATGSATLQGRSSKT